MKSPQTDARSERWPRHRPIRRIGVLLVPDFSLISYAAALEPFRAANRLSGRALYHWSHFSPDGRPVRASNGLQIAPVRAAQAGIDADLLVVCAGGNPASFRHGATFAALRQAARNGIRIAGISGGPFVMARAGLLDGYRCTIHWEHIPAFVEAFPRHDLRRTLYEIDRDRMTCAGGTAALDMMHRVIAADQGPELASAMAEWFLHTHVRGGEEPQRMPVRERLAVGHPKLVRVLEVMDGNIEQPKSRTHLAGVAALSVRQLERLFRSYLGRSIAEHYRELRLRRAQVLLVQTTLSVLEVAVASGFVSASHFSRVYKIRFGHSPRADRSAALRVAARWAMSQRGKRVSRRGR